VRRATCQLFAGLVALVSTSLVAGRAHAVATFKITITDPPGVGFNDLTPKAPVGGNTGTTVGEQRRIAFDYALGIWGKLLESPVPIVVSVGFAPLECTQGFAVLGHAGPASVQLDVPGVDPSLILPEALADQIAGFDLSPGMPDIEGEFNGGLAECSTGLDWYYGLDRKGPRNTSDLVSVVLHEMAHGLGFLTLIDPETGEDLVPGYSDPFSIHLLDVATNKHWHEMTPAERMNSGSAIRGLVWDGRYAIDAAPTVLVAGAPRISTVPSVPGFSGAVIDGNFGRPLAQASVVGRLAATTPRDACMPVSGVSGSIAVAVGDVCHGMSMTYNAQQAGALALLITDESVPPANLDVPTEDLASRQLSIPALGISATDAALLLAAPAATVTLSTDPTQLTGADQQGRVYMYASSPRARSRTASHFDPVARPDLIMEPSQSRNGNHGVVLERALLRDIGWRTLCGNGMIDPNEECDTGPANSDTTANACRTTCRRAACRDGVVDTGEICDPGASLSGDPTCTMTCTRPVCGNGMQEAAEECDSGMANSDSARDACRTTCKKASCGDRVVDTGEACDDALTPATCTMCANAGTGGGAGTSSTGGSSGGGAGGSNSGSAGDSSAGGSSGGDDDGGCGCRINGSRPASALVLALLALLALGVRRNVRFVSCNIAGRRH
jgi:hypothetical protein